MTLARMGLVALALAIPVAASSTDYFLPAGDVVHERIFEIQPLAGWFSADDNAGYGDGAPLLGLRGSLNNSQWWALEAQVSLSPGQKHLVPRGMLNSYQAQPVFDTSGRFVGLVVTELQRTESVEELDARLLSMGGTMLFHLSKKKIRPFLSLGGGFLDDIAAKADQPGAFANLFFDFGGGVKYYRTSGWSLRLDVRDVVTRKNDLPRDSPDAPILAAIFDVESGGGRDGVPGQEPYSPVEYRGRRWLHDLEFSVSVSVPFGWAWKDGDGDNVATRFDKCPTTAPSVIVDASGCGIDSDDDGVFDGIDTCAKTPKGATVDHVGCPSDTDSDGVFDGIDIANDTPTGATVDEQGQHHDGDKDGILDGLDSCDDTPPGAIVDARGCTADPMEDALLRGKPSQLRVRFESNSDELDPRSFRSINKFALIVERWTSAEEHPLKMEVSVQAHRPGSEGLKLAQQRADAIRGYMLDRFRGIETTNFVASAVPADVEGEARVDLRVLGPGERPPTRVEPETLAPPAPETPVVPEIPAPETPGTPPEGEAPKAEGEVPKAPESEAPKAPEPETPK